MQVVVRREGSRCRGSGVRLAPEAGDSGLDQPDERNCGSSIAKIASRVPATGTSWRRSGGGRVDSPFFATFPGSFVAASCSCHSRKVANGQSCGLSNCCLARPEADVGSPNYAYASPARNLPCRDRESIPHRGGGSSMAVPYRISCSVERVERRRQFTPTTFLRFPKGAEPSSASGSAEMHTRRFALFPGCAK